MGDVQSTSVIKKKNLSYYIYPFTHIQLTTFLHLLRYYTAGEPDSAKRDQVDWWEGTGSKYSRGGVHAQRHALQGLQLPEEASRKWVGPGQQVWVTGWTESIRNVHQPQAFSFYSVTAWDCHACNWSFCYLSKLITLYKYLILDWKKLDWSLYTLYKHIL